MSRVTVEQRTRESTRMAFAACIWSVLFAATNVFWGLGGRLAFPFADYDATVSDPSFVAANSGAVALKLGMAMLAVATTRAWTRSSIRRVLLAGVWVLGLGMTTYGALGIVFDTLRIVGMVDAPASANWVTVRWHLFLWDPWWLAGGLLFIATARAFQRRTAQAQRPGRVKLPGRTRM